MAEAIKPMIEHDLKELQHRYSMLNTPTRQEVCADGLERCKPDSRGRPPCADQIQVLVTVRRVLRKLR
jgi:hypothetical protein